jgi:hypothetical protein
MNRIVKRAALSATLLTALTAYGCASEPTVYDDASDLTEGTVASALCVSVDSPDPADPESFTLPGPADETAIDRLEALIMQGDPCYGSTESLKPLGLASDAAKFIFRLGSKVFKVRTPRSSKFVTLSKPRTERMRNIMTTVVRRKTATTLNKMGAFNFYPELLEQGGVPLLDRVAYIVNRAPATYSRQGYCYEFSEFASWIARKEGKGRLVDAGELYLKDLVDMLTVHLPSVRMENPHHAVSIITVKEDQRVQTYLVDLTFSQFVDYQGFLKKSLANGMEEVTRIKLSDSAVLRTLMKRGYIAASPKNIAEYLSVFTDNPSAAKPLLEKVFASNAVDMQRGLVRSTQPLYSFEKYHSVYESTRSAAPSVR